MKLKRISFRKFCIINYICGIMKAQIHHTIKSMVNSFLPNAQVLLFGSRARGDSAIDSDYDLLIITQETFTPRVKMT